MIEAHEDITLVVDQQLQDVRSAQEEAQAVADGREVHPAILAAQAKAAEAAALAEAQASQEVVPSGNKMSPVEPTGDTLLLRGILAIAFTALFLFLWFRQRRA